jgi:3-dehydroquinate synthase
MSYLAKAHSWLAQNRASRKSNLLAFGGGVIGDLAGFVAATYMRGIDLIQIPTSLLAMVDSSVGGKVAIDIPEGKNLVGAFYPPKSVAIPLEALATLPERHLLNGMAEVWKYAFIGNLELLSLLEVAGGQKPPIREVVERCVRQKAEVVREDEFDLTGHRAALNFGHTVGHALETYLEYEDLLHGEAIAIGMVVESKLAERLGVSEPDLASTIEQKLQKAGFKTSHPALKDGESLINLMGLDKKATSGGLAFSLVPRIGECKLTENVPIDAVRSTLQDL